MIRDEASQRQVDAANPVASTWLTANAGSGKTRVLTDRVARLLLGETAPQNILCLTYTKAAAAEMQNRLFQRLGDWAMKDDADLRDQLAQLGVDQSLDAISLSKARTLFASAIETPGGLKIQTIHSFCASILRRFPLEAGVSPQFQEMEDRAAVLLRAEVVDAMAQGPDRPVVYDLMRHFTGAEIDKLLAEVTSRRKHFASPTQIDDLRAALDLRPDQSADALISEVFSRDNQEIITDLINVLRTGGTNDNKAADKLAKLSLNAPGFDDLAILESTFLFGEKAKTPYGAKIDSFPTKALRAAHPELIDALIVLMEEVEASRDTRLTLQAFERSRVLHNFAHPFVTRYAAQKTARGLLDFDDLIDKAAALLTDWRVAQWVLYRLDGGIDHVLVDEAQDTSPAQWTVIKNLTQELTSGVSERDGNARTIFVVGDKKQSIYSFQGADPREFDRMQAHYDAALAPPGPGLRSTDLRHSFRSSQAILSTVDATFADPDKRDAIGHDEFHIAFKSEMPGRVDLWPVIEKTEEPEKDKDAWYNPVDQPQTSHHDVQMANQIAGQIKRMIADEYLPTDKGRRHITEGDFLILVQRRSTLFSEIIRACKAAGLRVAGADRFRVGAVLAVRDIAALLNFLALPDDDLSLAAALRSPLFGWSEQDLYTLAHHRPAKGVLWEALRNSSHQQTLAILHDLLKQADFLRPYDLIDRILVRHDGRRNLLARLGTEAEDGIDALLSQALAFESMGTPSLTGFLSWMDTDDLEIKRQMDNQGDQIRVMSVHGSKGLEAPIVILPDCAARKTDVKDEILIAGETALWKTKAADDPPAIADQRAAKVAALKNERLRLLYVAMTRAENWLIVGAAGDLGKDGDSWHDLVNIGMAQVGANDALAGSLPILRHTHGEWGAGHLQHATDPLVTKVELPDFTPLPEVTRDATLSPSDLGGEKTVPGDPAQADQEEALAIGRSFHLLLEHLPTVPAAQRRDMAARVMAAAPDVHSEAVSQALIADAITVLDTPALAHIFAPDARAEVGITANLPDLNGARIHGAIDRLIITDTHILAVDFKTNRKVPPSAEEVPEGLLRQMGAYAAALAQIYPDRQIDTAILWTRSATLMPLPAQIVAAALARVTTS
ncbi:double-strand break repair helicase AddA [Yoonia sp. R2331]|uniref:double-strand break repair helicase AddA n=1 Tax=Yoonia sp. R2331 TaxID=3237238 RepID=UPI0034E587E7